MATHIPGGTTQYFCLLVFLVPVSGLSELAESLTTLGVAQESVFLGLLSSLCLSLFLGLSLCSETVALLLALLGNTRFLRSEEEKHLLAFELWHLLYLGILLQVIGKAQQQYLALLLEKNGTTTENT